MFLDHSLRRSHLPCSQESTTIISGCLFSIVVIILRVFYSILHTCVKKGDV